MKQTSFASLAFDHKKKKTRRERFLEQMEQVVPWGEFLSVIEPHYPKAKPRGGRPIGLEVMLRIHLMQNWFNLSDPGMEDALYEIESMRRFAGLDLLHDRIPDESTILKFRHLLEKHQLTDALFASINVHLANHGLGMSKGTMVDATIIQAPSSTKNKTGKRDPEMRSTRKNNQYYFGLKLHAGVDVNSGTAHSITVTAANEADISQLPNLLRPDDQAVFGDAGYASDEYKRGSRHLGLSWQVNDKAKPKHAKYPGLSGKQKRKNQKKSSVRARVEHLFRTIKRQFGFVKTRYKGLAKNRSQLTLLVGLANLYQQREVLGA